MTIGERIRQIRKEEGLSLDRFGYRIGLKQAVVSLMENGKSKVTDQTILSICREFNICEAWLRNGEGPMREPDRDDLDECLDRWGLPREFRGLFLAYRDLETDAQRNAVRDFIRKATTNVSSEKATVTPIPDSVPVKAQKDMTRDEKIAAFTQQLDEKEATDGEACKPVSSGDK